MQEPVALVPYLREITAINMERYLEAVHQFALTNYPSVAPWIRGRIPKVMLEHELSRDKARMLGLLAKLHTLDDGSRSLVNLTAGQVRNIMIQRAIDEDELEANENLLEGEEPTTVSPQEALKSMFPSNASKSREIERSNLGTSAANLLGKMLFAWPTKDIQLKMQATSALMEAFDNTDVILFLEELRAFSLAGPGNPEANREAAEKHLTGLEMEPGKVLEYLKDFTEAVEHIKVCKSSFTEFRVVDLFFRHLDQILFPQWYVKFLSDDEQLYRFQELSFEDAKNHALRYHNTVIRVNERTATPKRESQEDPKRHHNNNNKMNPINTVRNLKAAVAGAQGTGGSIMVSQAVLATLIGGKRKGVDGAKDKPKISEGVAKLLITLYFDFLL